ncbi:MAG: hypothetical protein KAY24_04580, partial [Candidatus Eisenbacteria sp.]|nr:hypothetical protein [Candidatus Eisenbacteria bacterium]
MKKKMKGVLGVGLTLVLLVSLCAFAIPVAADPAENEWSEFAYPAEGSAGDWFYDPTIAAVGPMAQAINGDLYAYALVGIADKLFKSEDGGRTWAESTATHAYNGGAIVDMVCSSIDEDILYVTDGNYVYKSVDGGDTFAPVAAGSLEKVLMGACGEPVTGKPITCLDVGYDASDNPFVFIGVRYTYAGPPSVLYIEEMAYPSEWGDLELDCYGEGGYTPYSVGAAPDFADSKKTYAVVSSIASLGGNAEWGIVAGRYSAKLVFVDAHVYVDITQAAGYTIADFIAATATDFGFWYFQDAEPNFGPQLELKFDDPGSSAYIDVTFMLQTNTTLNQWTWVDLDGPFGAIGTWNGANFSPYADLAAVQAGIGTFSTYELTRVRVELYHDYVDMPERTCYIDDVTINGVTYALPGETHVVSTTGTPCVWTEVAELLKDNNLANSFAITDASRIAFPDDYEDTNTLFVGVVDVGTDGGDVYSVTKPKALDLDVFGTTDATNIISLDIMGDTEEALLIAGQNDSTDVYYSTDGGWTWDASVKDPTGDNTTYALWVGDSALAATSGIECAVSMSCGEEVGEYWDQISLIATAIDAVIGLDHSPGYITESETLFMLTDSTSLFRYDQTYWERVFCNTTYPGGIDMVGVSPDFNTTDTLYVGNTGFDIWRSTDAGCSWTELRYSPNTATMNSAVVIDED